MHYHKNECYKKKAFARKTWFSCREWFNCFFLLFCEPDNLEHVKSLGGHSGQGLVIYRNSQIIICGGDFKKETLIFLVFF